MTTPEDRPSAPIVYHATRGPIPPWRDSLGFWAAIDGDGDSRTVHRAPRPDGQLWQREAARDVQAHGEPMLVGAPRMFGIPNSTTPRAWLQGMIERRRPAMRATRAELEALSGNGRASGGLLFPGARDAAMPTRLEPEPSSMARAGLALGLAFTSDDAKA